MRLADLIAQCRTPFVVEDNGDGRITHLQNAAAFAQDIARCATRYVLSDELVRLSTALAYSKGANTLACADVLHVPAERVWVEWAETPWREELAGYGFNNEAQLTSSGRRGVFIQSNPRGRRGVLKTFWTAGKKDMDVLCSSMEAHFDFDADEEHAHTLNEPQPGFLRVWDQVAGEEDLLRRCFRFRFERSWQDYYKNALLTPAQWAALSHHALGTIATDIPVLLAFFLLLATRPGLPRRPLMLERLNKARAKSGKAPLLEQIEVCAPLIPEYQSLAGIRPGVSRHTRRLHHVRGHLVRRGSKLFWRVPHLRGNARAGSIRTRTVTWQFDPSPSPSTLGKAPRPSARM